MISPNLGFVFVYLQLKFSKPRPIRLGLGGGSSSLIRVAEVLEEKWHRILNHPHPSSNFDALRFGLQIAPFSLKSKWVIQTQLTVHFRVTVKVGGFISFKAKIISLLFRGPV